MALPNVGAFTQELSSMMNTIPAEMHVSDTGVICPDHLITKIILQHFSHTRPCRIYGGWAGQFCSTLGGDIFFWLTECLNGLPHAYIDLLQERGLDRCNFVQGSGTPSLVKYHIKKNINKNSDNSSVHPCVKDHWGSLYSLVNGADLRLSNG